MTNESVSKSSLPTVPAPVYSAQPTMSTTITTQPKPISQMSVEDSEVLRMRGGCGCLVGGLAVETGYVASLERQLRIRAESHRPTFMRRPCICHTSGYGLLGTLEPLILREAALTWYLSAGCLACIVVFIPNIVVGGVIGTVNCLLCV